MTALSKQTLRITHQGRAERPLMALAAVESRELDGVMQVDSAAGR